jgi:hypothetical protein
MNSPVVTVELVGYVVAAVVLVVPIVLWVNARFGSLWRAHDAHRLYAAETYATKASVNDGFNRLEGKIDKVDTKLDQILINSSHSKDSN